MTYGDENATIEPLNLELVNGYKIVYPATHGIDLVFCQGTFATKQIC